MMAGSVAEPEDRATGERRGSGMPLIPVPIKGGGKNVFKTFEMAIRHNRRLTRTQLDFSVAGFTFTLFSNISLALVVLHRPSPIGPGYLGWSLDNSKRLLAI